MATTNNMYQVTVQASDGGVDTTATEEVTIQVTNVEEPGTVTLSTLQPQVDVVIMATLDDPDATRRRTPLPGSGTGAAAPSRRRGPMAHPTPCPPTLPRPVTKVVGCGPGPCTTTARAKTRRPRKIRLTESGSAPVTNTDPVFPDQDPNAAEVQTEQTREVAENTPAGRNLGPRVDSH